MSSSSSSFTSGVRPSAGGVERALETYYLAKKQKEHENSLRAVSMPGRSGIGGATWKTRAGTPRQRRCAPSVSETGSMRPRGACCVVTAQSQWTSAPLWWRWSWMASSGTCWSATAPSPGSLSSRAPGPELLDKDEGEEKRQLSVDVSQLAQQPRNSGGGAQGRFWRGWVRFFQFFIDFFDFFDYEDLYCLFLGIEDRNTIAETCAAPVHRTLCV